MRRRPAIAAALVERLDLAHTHDLGCLEEAVGGLCLRSTVEPWLVAARRLLALSGPAELARGKAARARIVDRLGHAGFLFDLEDQHRARIVALMEALGTAALAALRDPRRQRMLAAFLGTSAGSDEPYHALLRAIQPDEHWQNRFTRRLLARMEEGVVDPEQAQLLADRSAEWPAIVRPIAEALAAEAGRAPAPPQHQLAIADPDAAVPADEPWRARLLALQRGTPRPEPEDAAAQLALSAAALAHDAEEALALARTLGARGFHAEAAAILQPWLAASPDAALAHGRAAERALGRQARADLWSSHKGRHPTTGIALAHAVALADTLDYSGARDLIDAAICAHPSRSGLRRARVRLAERIGALGEALALARSFAADLPDDAVLAAEARRLEAELGEGSGVGEALTPRAQAVRAIADGQPGAALDALKAAYARSRGANDAAALLNATLLAGQVEEGEALARGLDRRFAGDPRFPLKLAQLAERREDWSAALDGFARALDRAPHDPAARAGIARALVYLRRLDAARAWLADCARDSGDLCFWTLPTAAFVEMRVGDREAARSALDRAYNAGRRHLGQYLQARERDRRLVYLLDGELRPHPNEAADASMAIWDRFLASLAEGEAALIGNAPSLAGSGHGAAIDDAQPVIRLNDFRVAGFEQDVGQRTDYWFSSANRQADPDRAGVAEAIAMLAQSHAVHFPDLPAFATGRLGFPLDPARAGFLPPYVHMLSDALLYPVPTTGMRMVLILEFLCQRPVCAYGFDFFAGDRMHYFDEGRSRLRVGESHAVGFERDFAQEVLGEIGRYVRFC